MEIHPDAASEETIVKFRNLKESLSTIVTGSSSFIILSSRILMPHAFWAIGESFSCFILGLKEVNDIFTSSFTSIAASSISSLAFNIPFVKASAGFYFVKRWVVTRVELPTASFSHATCSSFSIGDFCLKKVIPPWELALSQDWRRSMLSSHLRSLRLWRLCFCRWP